MMWYCSSQKKTTMKKKCQIQANQDVSLILSYALNFQKMMQLWGSRWFKKGQHKQDHRTLANMKKISE